MANHLLIGLGGTGGKVLREFRKKVYEEFRSNEPTNGTCINYLYVDSSEDDLNSREGWKVMGKYVHLKEAQKVSIHGLGMNMFQNLSLYPGIKCFLNSGDIDLMTSKLYRPRLHDISARPNHLPIRRGQSFRTAGV